MTLLVILSVLPILISAILIRLSIDNINLRYTSKTMFRSSLIKLISGILILAITLTAISMLIRKSDIDMNQNSKMIISTYNGKIKIYQDYTTEKYFILRYNHWNLLNLRYREYIDTEEAEELINALRIVNSWED